MEDVDFERSAPTICHALCAALAVPAPELEAIVRDRDAWLEATSCAKDMVSKVMNGWAQDQGAWHPRLHALRAEMRALDLALAASGLSAPTRAVLGSGAPAESVRRAVVDTLEDCALSVVVDTFERAGSLCVGRIFDGAHQLKCASDGRALDLPAIALVASAAVEAALGIALVARVKPFELPFDADNDEYCESVDEALTADVLFAEDEHPRPTKVCDIVDLIIERFSGQPWMVVDEKRILLVSLLFISIRQHSYEHCWCPV
mmetsp:Transcript_26875/g.61959  ORF Transcript_26875/g.61959 Transcript_26875/m.61959 type:complete len:261 (+) Transcript_26875:912-1694(+)